MSAAERFDRLERQTGEIFREVRVARYALQCLERKIDALNSTVMDRTAPAEDAEHNREVQRWLTYTVHSVTELIDLWPSIGAFAEELGCGYEAARKMRSRNAANVRYWPALIEIAHAKDLPISYEWLVHAHTAQDPAE